MVQDLRIKDIVAGHDTLATKSTVNIVTEDDFATNAMDDLNGVNIPVEFTDTEEIIIPEIKDLHGRLSDIIEDAEDKTGMAVIPFEMVGIASEVVRLQRYNIFTIGDKKYAMSKMPRERVVKQYLERIVKTLSNGLPYNESLITSVSFGDSVYKTLTLSQVEWSLILSKFRRYKQRLYICNGSDVIMEILAERV